MKKAKQCLIALLSGVLLAITVLSGCGQSQKAVSKNDDHRGHTLRTRRTPSVLRQ